MVNSRDTTGNVEEEEVPFTADTAGNAIEEDDAEDEAPFTADLLR